MADWIILTLPDGKRFRLRPDEADAVAAELWKLAPGRATAELAVRIAEARPQWTVRVPIDLAAREVELLREVGVDFAAAGDGNDAVHRPFLSDPT